MPAGGYDPLADGTTAIKSADGLKVDFNKFETWNGPNPSYPFTIDFTMQVTLGGFVAFTENYSITIFDCTTLIGTMTPPSVATPSSVTVEFGQGFDHTVNWSNFKFAGHEAYCPVTHELIKIAYPDGGISHLMQRVDTYF